MAFRTLRGAKTELHNANGRSGVSAVWVGTRRGEVADRLGKICSLPAVHAALDEEDCLAGLFGPASGILLENWVWWRVAESL